MKHLKYFCCCYFLVFCIGVISAQETTNDVKLHFDIIPSFRMSLDNNQWHYGHGVDLYLNYDVLPELKLGVVCGYSSFFPSRKVTSLPLLFRLKSEFIKGPVVPYFQCSLGYSFGLIPKQRIIKSVKINKEYFPERYKSLGFETGDAYIEYCVQEVYKRYEGITDSEMIEKRNQEVSQARVNATSMLTSLEGGSNMYIPCDKTVDYIKQGLVFDFGCGASWHFNVCSLSFGLTLGCSQSFYGAMVETVSGIYLPFDNYCLLPDGKTQVIACVRRDFWQRFGFDIQICIGVSF